MFALTMHSRPHSAPRTQQNKAHVPYIRCHIISRSLHGVGGQQQIARMLMPRGARCTTRASLSDIAPVCYCIIHICYVVHTTTMPCTSVALCCRPSTCWHPHPLPHPPPNTHSPHLQILMMMMMTQHSYGHSTHYEGVSSCCF